MLPDVSENIAILNDLSTLVEQSLCSFVFVTGILPVGRARYL